MLSLQISVVGIMFDRLNMTVLNRHLDFLVGQREIPLPKSIGPYQTWNDQVIGKYQGEE